MKQHAPYLIIWTLLWALFFGTILIGTEHIAGGDFAGQFHAYGRFQAREMLAGRLPLWSDGSFGGVPFVADTQAAVFYLPRWLTILLSAPWDFPYYALELEALVHIWLAGTFTYALAYRITYSRWGGLVAAVAFGLGGYLTSYPLVQLAVLETITWLPLALYCLHRGVRERRVGISRPPLPRALPVYSRNLSSFAGAGLALTVAFTAGHPQTFLHVSYVTAAYYLFLVTRAWWYGARIIGTGLLVGGIALGGAAAAWLPAVAYLPYTVRSDIGYAFVSGGQQLLTYLQLLVPRALTQLTPEYVGLPALLFAILALTHRNKMGSRRRMDATFWGVVALLAAWLALGDKGILFELWYYVAPGFQLFRQQERLISIGVFALALLAAHGVDVWTHLKVRERQAAVKKAALIVLAGFAVAAVFLAVIPSVPASEWLAILGRQLILLGIAAVLLYAPIQTWRAAPLLILLVVSWGDLYVATLGGVEREEGSPRVFWPQPDWMSAVRAAPAPGRFDPGLLYFANVGEAYGVETVRGISPLKPQLLADVERLPLWYVWRLLNVTHGLFVDSAPGDLAPHTTAVRPAVEALLPDERRDGTALYRFDAAFPRAWMVYEHVPVANREEAFATLTDAKFDLARQVILLETDAQQYAVAPPEAEPSVQVSQPYSGALDVRVQSGAAGYLVISEWALPGWRATVNGRDADVLKANYGLQAIWLPAGEHALSVRFRPWQVYAGMAISLVTLLVAAVIWRIERR